MKYNFTFANDQMPNYWHQLNGYFKEKGLDYRVGETSTSDKYYSVVTSYKGKGLVTTYVELNSHIYATNRENVELRIILILSVKMGESTDKLSIFRNKLKKEFGNNSGFDWKYREDNSRQLRRKTILCCSSDEFDPNVKKDRRKEFDWLAQRLDKLIMSLNKIYSSL